MRLAFALALAAMPAAASDMPILEQPCMDVIGPLAYGPQNFDNGVMAGIGIGYAIHLGYQPEDASFVGQTLGAICRENIGHTFGDTLEALPAAD